MKKKGASNFQNRVVDSEDEYPNNFNTNRQQNNLS